MGNWTSWDVGNCNFKQNIQKRSVCEGEIQIKTQTKSGSPPEDFWGEKHPWEKEQRYVFRDEQGCDKSLLEGKGLEWKQHLLSHSIFYIGILSNRTKWESAAHFTKIGPQLDDCPASLLIFGSMLVIIEISWRPLALCSCLFSRGQNS